METQKITKNVGQSNIQPTSPEPAKRKFYLENTPSESTSEDPEQEKRLGEAMKILLAWPDFEVWPFKVSCPILGVIGAIPGAVINSAFRSTLLLGNVGKMSSYLTTMGLPMIASGIAHYGMIAPDILSEKTPCSTCVQVRAAMLQSTAAVLYPTVFTPVVNLMIGSRIKNLYLPKIQKDPKEIFNLVVDVFKSKKVKTRLALAAAVQPIFAMGLTYLEQDCYFSTVRPILTGERKISKPVHKYPEKGY